MYGAIFAVAIAIIYLPPELTLRQAGRMLQSVSVQKLETESPRTPGDEVAHWLEQVSQRARVGQALGLEVPILTRLQTSLGIFAPLLISIIAVFLPHQPH